MNNNENKFNEKISKIEMIVGDIQEAIDSKDEQQLKSYLVQFNSNIRNLLKEANKDKLRYLIIQYLNRLMANAPTVRVSASENLNEVLNKCLDEVKFEKQALLELRSYLKSFARDKDYTNLALSFGILILILGMHNERNGRLSVAGDVWKCGISGINYMPVSTSDGNVTLKSGINEGLEALARKRVRN